MTKEKKIYICTKGCYSSYSIYAVFEDWESACEYRDTHNKYRGCGDEMEIETWAINGKSNKKYLSWYFVFDKKTGQLNDHESDVSTFPYTGDEPVWESDSDIRMYVDHWDRDQALKIACDMKAKYLAEKYGIA